MNRYRHNNEAQIEQDDLKQDPSSIRNIEQLQSIRLKHEENLRNLEQ